MCPIATTYKELNVYQNAFKGAMEIFVITQNFPNEERYSLTDQIRRSSRSICSNLAEGWRKRRYKAAFIAKLSDAESEAAETQVWIEMARQCGYLSRDKSVELDDRYDHIMSQLVVMMDHADRWLLR